jgi:photosystem II stability/assembly factor-like uncharacterized protein
MLSKMKSRFPGKKYSLILLAAITIFTFGGFHGCFEIYDFFIYRLNVLAYGWVESGDSDSFELAPYGISVGDNGSINIQDGGPGYPWIEITSPTSENLNNVKIFDDSTVAIAVGNNGTVIRSRDEGYSWQDLSIPSVTNNLYGLDFLNYWQAGLFVVVCGENGSVYSSTDSGGNWTWQQLNTPTTKNLTSIGAITTDIIIAVGDSGTIIRTSDSGQTWDDLSVPDPNINFNRLLISTFYPNFNRVWAVGDNGIIYASTDYGFSWFPQNSNTNNNLYDLAFRNSDEGIAAGENGTVMYTTNGGSTWVQDPELGDLTTNHIISVAKLDSNTASALIVSSLGGEAALADTTFILTVSSEPIVGIDVEHNLPPATFNIFQNFPNPYNPTTIINYQVADAGFVTLKVYDVIGNEVASLVNENKGQGSYIIMFDATNLPSGIYFYRLQAGSFVETKKMVLMK